MNVLQKNIVNAIPYARRYGRALTGDTDFSDLVITQAAISMIQRAPCCHFLIPTKLVLPWLLVEFHRQLDSNHVGSASTVSVDINELDPFHEETLYERLDQALRCLSETQRRIFLLTTLEQYKPKVIGRILSIPANEVKQQFKQANVIVTDNIAELALGQAA